MRLTQKSYVSGRDQHMKTFIRREESEKALEQVFAACTNACSITTAGVKLREALEKNREYEKVNEVQKQTIRGPENYNK